MWVNDMGLPYPTALTERMLFYKHRHSLEYIMVFTKTRLTYSCQVTHKCTIDLGLQGLRYATNGIHRKALLETSYNKLQDFF